MFSYTHSALFVGGYAMAAGSTMWQSMPCFLTKSIKQLVPRLTCCARASCNELHYIPNPFRFMLLTYRAAPAPPISPNIYFVPNLILLSKLLVVWFGLIVCIPKPVPSCPVESFDGSQSMLL